MVFWRNYKIRKHDTYTYKKTEYVNAIISFDTETTTAFLIGSKWQAQDFSRPSKIYTDAPKRAFVYIWQIAINDDVIYGREIGDFFEFWERFTIVNPYMCIVYVHNLGFDFEFINEFLPSDTTVFAKAAYKPMYVRIPSLNIEFRCSYMLTNMSLETCANNFQLSVKKLKGELVYNVLRLPNTKLTVKELQYCENDVRIINAMIKEIFLPNYSCIADIPLTQTGEVRREVKARLKTVPYHMKNMNSIKPDLKMYIIFTKVLQGGYTHLNYFHCNCILENVTSFDKASSYPDIMCTRLFPIGKFRPTKEYIKGDKDYAYLLYIRCEKIRAISCWSYIARHKVTKAYKCKSDDNGKLNYAEKIEMWVTDIDYEIIRDNYKIENGGKIEIVEMYKSYKQYLPREYILMILERYNKKTELKGVSGMQALYMRTKQQVNSFFGNMLTSEIHDDIIYNAISHVWENNRELEDSEIEDMLHKNRPYLFYAWGIWVTAYARDDLFRLLMKINFDAVYSDTDSIKMRNAQRYQHLIDGFNIECDERIKAVCKHYDLDISLFYPKDKKGIIHPLGHFENEGTYKKFLSIGAKKYCFIDENDKLNVVVAGLKKSYVDRDGKHNTIQSMDDFRIGKHIPNARTVHWHLSEQENVEMVDEQGNKYTVKNKNGIAIMNADYTFGLSEDYKGFILDARNKYTDLLRLCY